MQVLTGSLSEVLDLLAAGHDQIERLCTELLALPRSRAAEPRALWLPLAAVLTAHLDEEDMRLVPALFAFAGREARALILEHRHLRARIDELDQALGSGALDTPSLRLFAEEVLAHHRREQALLARYAEAP